MLIMHKETCLNWLIKQLQSAGGKWKIRKYGFGFCSQINKGSKESKRETERERDEGGLFWSYSNIFVCAALRGNTCCNHTSIGIQP